MIGQGAMGQVWKAKDLLAEKARGRNPYVAIKVLTSDYEQDPRSFEGMQREASRAQQLAHPNIVTVYTFDQDDRSGRVFIAMELLDGRPLDRLLRDAPGGALAADEAWKIIRGVAEGLAYAHRKGIVHSDLKPANIFLTGDGVPKVLDFGIARAAKQADDGSGLNEDDSVMSGYTVTYAAPEVFDEAPPDTADDVFALGVVAYEILTGEHPFARRPANEVRARHDRPEPIRGVSRRQWRAIAHALELERSKRLPDAGAFLRALQGSKPLLIGLAAAVVVLSVTAAVFAYRSYGASRPAIPFDQLPVAEQQYVRHALDSGNEALQLVRKEHIIEATADAADSFADAYEHHPRNPDAVTGLNEAADRFIDWSLAHPERVAALAQLRNFQQKSSYYAHYAPLQRAIEKLAAQSSK
jgi:serine/threonine protein kinase